MNRAMDAQVMSTITGHGRVPLKSSFFELEESSFSEDEAVAAEADKTTITATVLASISLALAQRTPSMYVYAGRKTKESKEE